MAILVGDADSNLLVGGSFADTIFGNGGQDTLFGRTGYDRLLGGSGNDWLYGERGDDRLSGGAGNDILVGGFGRDVLTGGAGRDTFAFDDLHTGAGAAADLITDLGAGDVIDLLAADITHYSSSGEPEVGGVNVVFADNGNARVAWYALGSLREITVLGNFTDYDDFIDNHLRYYEDDHFGGVGTGPLIEGNVTLRGSIDVPEDHDYFRLAFDPDRLYTVTVSGAGGEPLSEPGIFLVDPEGEYINEDWGWEGNPAQIQIAGGSGIYALGIWSVYFNGAGDYRLNVTSVAYQDDFGGWDDADHGRISVGKTKSGNIGHMGDSDAFDFAVEAGVTYTIHVRGAEGGAGTLENPGMEVVDENGDYVDSGGWQGDIHSSFTASETGTYTVIVFDDFGSDEEQDDTGTYRITIEADDPLNV